MFFIPVPTDGKINYNDDDHDNIPSNLKKGDGTSLEKFRICPVATCHKRYALQTKCNFGPIFTCDNQHRWMTDGEKGYRIPDRPDNFHNREGIEIENLVDNWICETDADPDKRGDYFKSCHFK